MIDAATPKQKARVGIVGGSGYTGLELIRLLACHPEVELVSVSSTQHAGKLIAELQPALAKLTSLKFVELGPQFTELDFVFVAAPHTEAMVVVGNLYRPEKGPKIIDLSGDFRLPKEQFEKYYEITHYCPELLNTAVYGSPELFKEEIATARLIANPGCFANCILLALAPLALANMAEAQVSVSALTGSTGSGTTATLKTHHPFRNESILAYNILNHRHVPEIEAALAKVSSGMKISLVPHSGPFSRGIFATCFAKAKSVEADLTDTYTKFQSYNHFIRFKNESPRLLDVRGSNYCDIAAFQKRDDIVILSVLDNLVKGAAGNAIQCMNIMAGFHETAGLTNCPLFL